jgi:hypothetical protein
MDPKGLLATYSGLRGVQNSHFMHSDEPAETLFQGYVADCYKILNSDHDKITSDVSSSANSQVLCNDLGMPMSLAKMLH